MKSEKPSLGHEWDNRLDDPKATVGGRARDAVTEDEPYAPPPTGARVAQQSELDSGEQTGVDHGSAIIACVYDNALRATRIGWGTCVSSCRIQWRTIPGGCHMDR